MLSVIGVVIAIALALLCLGIVLQYWMVIAAVVVGTLFFGPIGGIVGFFLGVFIKGSSNNRLEGGRQPRQNYANDQPYDQQTHQQHSDYTQHHASESDVTIESLVPIIQLISYFCLKKDNHWTSEKVRFVKEIFEDACETQADFQLLQQLMKSKPNNEYELVQQFIGMQPDYELRHNVFLHCGIALLFDEYSNPAIDSILSQLGQQLHLEQRDYREAINRWKNESNQQQYSHHHSQDSADKGSAGKGSTGQGSSNQHASSQSQLAWAQGILGLDHRATEAEVKKAFRQKMAQYHPDKNQNVTEAVQQLLNEKTVEVQKARDIIMSGF